MFHTVFCVQEAAEHKQAKDAAEQVRSLEARSCQFEARHNRVTHLV
jgi:hypothetical protein